MIKKKQITKEDQVVLLAKEYSSLVDASKRLKDDLEGLDDTIDDYLRPDMDKNDWYDIQAHLFNQAETYKIAIDVVKKKKNAIFDELEDLTGAIAREKWEKEEENRKSDNLPPF